MRGEIERNWEARETKNPRPILLPPRETHLTALTQTQMATPMPPRETHLAADCSICLVQLRCSSLHNSRFTLKYLIYPSKPNIMIVNLKICACGVCVFTNEWWWWLWIEYMNLWLCLWLPVLKRFFFFFFGFFLVFGFVSKVILYIYIYI